MGKVHELVGPLCLNVVDTGRPPIGLTRILRMYFAQQCSGLSDEVIDLARESAPDATTLRKFLHLLEAKELKHPIFDAINEHGAEKAWMMRWGTIVDATLSAAPPSTKNKDGKRDPQRHQLKKGRDGLFRMKAHVGVDAASGLVHTVVGTAGPGRDSPRRFPVRC